jgi:DNA transformation protein and related proteins
MAVSDGFVQFVVDQLSDCGVILPKRMFGGVGLYAGDLFFAILANDVLYLKVDGSNRGDFEAAGQGPFRPYGDDRETMQYYQVPPEVLEDPDELARWARKAISVAVTARTARSRNKSARSPRTRRAHGGSPRRSGTPR